MLNTLTHFVKTMLNHSQIQRNQLKTKCGIISTSIYRTFLTTYLNCSYRKRRTLTDMGSRTPAKSRKRLLKEPATPTKKIADLISRKEEGEDVVKGINSMKKEIEGKLHLLPLHREEETVNVKLKVCR